MYNLLIEIKNDPSTNKEQILYFTGNDFSSNEEDAWKFTSRLRVWEYFIKYDSPNKTLKVIEKKERK